MAADENGSRREEETTEDRRARVVALRVKVVEAIRRQKFVDAMVSSTIIAGVVLVWLGVGVSVVGLLPVTTLFGCVTC